MIWVLAALLSSIAVLLTVRPLLRTTSQPAGQRSDFDLAVYKDQLTELEEEHGQGLIDDQAALAAKLEIQRRLLTASHAHADQARPLDKKGRLGLLVALLVLLPLCGLALYGLIGQPKQADQPYLERLAQRMNLDRTEAQHRLDEVERLTLILGLKPTDGASWRDLGRAQRLLLRHADAADSLRHALLNGERDPDLVSEMGESLVYAAQGEVTPDAVQAFNAVLLAAPNHPKALYFLGQSRMQDNDAKGALVFWKRMEAASPPDAPWLSLLKGRIAEAEALASGKAPATANGAPDIAAMVKRLEARMKDNPNDVQGWSMLGRSYAALGEIDRAVDAYGRAAKLAPNDLEIIQSHAVMLYEAARANDPKAKVPAEALALMNKVLERDAKAVDALFLAGQAALDAGNKKEAKALWTRLLEQLEPESPDHGEMKRMIDGL
ncbi:MAG: c-type cytochrome biogenesis protein CcmI [Alphaproteobacteria bacterium]|nr:c-type cytochrome biogenesis protein CcmI [Alphaproteobacteria bacterium]